MQKRNSLLFLLSWVVLFPLAFFLSFHRLTNVLEFLFGVVWCLVTVLVSVGFWKLRKTNRELGSILVVGCLLLAFAISFLADVGNTPVKISPLIDLLFAIIMGVLGFICLYIVAIMMITAIRFFRSSFHSIGDPEPLASSLFQDAMLRTCGEALLRPLPRK